MAAAPDGGLGGRRAEQRPAPAVAAVAAAAVWNSSRRVRRDPGS